MDSTNQTIASAQNPIKWREAVEIKDKRQFTYVDAETERKFMVRRHQSTDGKAQFFLCEICPNGRLVELDLKDHVVHAWEDPRIKDIETRLGPNALISAVRNLGIDPDTMVFWGSGYSVNSIYHDSLNACSQAVVHALAENARYSSYRELSPKEKSFLRHLQALQCVEYWHAETVASRSAEREGSGLFEGCYNMMGRPLDVDARTQVLNYLDAPTRNRWLEIRSLAITSTSTLWQAWCAIDPLAPRSGQNGFPLPEVLRYAIRQAVEGRKSAIKNKLQEAGSHGLQGL